MPKHFVYILQSSNNRHYTGYTTDLERRMKQHKSGKGAKFTRAFGFKKLLYHEEHGSKSEALKREAEIKRWSRREKEFWIKSMRRIVCLSRVAKKGAPHERQQAPFPRNR